jgi:hypothetical protein
MAQLIELNIEVTPLNAQSFAHSTPNQHPPLHKSHIFQTQRTFLPNEGGSVSGGRGDGKSRHRASMRRRLHNPQRKRQKKASRNDEQQGFDWMQGLSDSDAEAGSTSGEIKGKGEFFVRSDHVVEVGDVVVRVVGWRRKNMLHTWAQSVPMFGVVAGTNFSKDHEIRGTDLFGKVFSHQEYVYKAGTSCHARELRAAGTGCKVVIDGGGCSLKKLLQEGKVGMLINSPSGRGVKSNVRAPTTVGKLHKAKRDIKAGEELLVGYGSQTRALVGGADLVRWQKLQPTDA